MRQGTVQATPPSLLFGKLAVGLLFVVVGDSEVGAAALALAAVGLQQSKQRLADSTWIQQQPH
jgi:hypothetical protein